MDILINEPEDFPLAALERLSAFGAVHRAGADYPADRIGVVFIRLKERLGPDFHQRHPALKYIVSPTTGLNHIDLDHFAAASVEVLSLRGRTDFLDNIHATSEHTLALTLALLRNLPAAVDDVRDGQWNRKPFQGSEIYGKTVLLIGYGRLGRQAHRLFEAFGARVIAHDIDPTKVPPALNTPIMDGLAQADIVSLHVSLTDQSEGFFDAECLSGMKPGAVLINTARGELLDQAALLAHLDSGHLRGAALDVLWDEPSPLTQDIRSAIGRLGSRLVITPHIGGLTWESLAAVEEHMTDVLIAELQRNVSA